MRRHDGSVLDSCRGKADTARLWVYAADDRGSAATSPPLVWYKFTPDRTGAQPQTELARFTGYLQSDTYAGCDKLYSTNRVIEVACWAHFRRKIFDIHATKPTPLTTDLMARIGAIYEIEAGIRGTPPDNRQRSRQERSGPLVGELRQALDDSLRRLSSKSEMAKALSYGRKSWAALTRFVDDWRLEIDNNTAERAMRCVVLGRKNWVYAGSKAGGERAAAIYTVIETAKLNGLEPQAYITEDIAKIAGGWPASRWDEPMPWNWQAQQDLDKLATQPMRPSDHAYISCHIVLPGEPHATRFLFTRGMLPGITGNYGRPYFSYRCAPKIRSNACSCKACD